MPRTTQHAHVLACQAGHSKLQADSMGFCALTPTTPVLPDIVSVPAATPDHPNPGATATGAVGSGVVTSSLPASEFSGAKRMHEGYGGGRVCRAMLRTSAKHAAAAEPRRQRTCVAAGTVPCNVVGCGLPGASIRSNQIPGAVVATFCAKCKSCTCVCRG